MYVMDSLAFNGNQCSRLFFFKAESQRGISMASLVEMGLSPSGQVPALIC